MAFPIFEPKQVPVYERDGTVIAYVSNRVRSIGAAKAAGVDAVEYTMRFSPYGWMVCRHCSRSAAMRAQARFLGKDRDTP